MLSGHSRLHIPDETWFIRPLVAQLPLTEPLSPDQVETALAIMTGHERWPDIGLPADAFARQVRTLNTPRLGDLIDLLFHHLARASGKPRIGDKTPHYFAIVPQLAAIFPQAGFIHLIRDGRDVAISWVDAGWNRYHERDFEWTAAMRARRKWNDSLLGRRVCEVRYEALVREPEQTLRGICAFLGEPFEPAMLHWAGRTGLVAARDRHLHGRLHQPLSEEAIGIWRQRLAPWECFAIESCLFPQLQALGYSPRYGARAWAPLRAVTRSALSAASPLLRRGVPWMQRRGWLRKRLYL